MGATFATKDNLAYSHINVTLVLTSLNLDLVQTFLAASRARSGLVHSTGPSLMHLAYRSTEPGEFFFALLSTLHFFQ